ncbi:hypothetical protein PT273_04370 [Orbaceae bacterium ESL0727]|nr:hypothetical protein [Orbaceae bacterium ESL0727]
MKIDKNAFCCGVLSGIVASSMVNVATNQVSRNIKLFSSYKRLLSRLTTDKGQMLKDFGAVGNDMCQAMKYYG